MQGEFTYQNYVRRWMIGLPFLAFYVFFWAEMLFGHIPSDILYYILNVSGLILLLAIYHGITRKSSFFIHVGKWHINEDTLTIVMDKKNHHVTISSISRMCFITNKQLFRFVAYFNLMEIRTNHAKIKIYSSDLDENTTYASDLFCLYQAVKKNARQLKIDTETTGDKGINEWLKK